MWELPCWGHSLSQGIFPLFIDVDNFLFPIGTAFSVGKGPQFLITAEHTIAEAIKREPILEPLRIKGQLPRHADIINSRLCVLHQRSTQTGVDFTLWPIERVSSAPPTDVVFAFPKFTEGLRTIAHRISLSLPEHGARVHSIGYVVDKYPKDGLPLADIKARRFDWIGEYAHRLLVVEGNVQRIFTQRFARGFLDGPCFLFDATIPHGLSGGPVISAGDGVVLGVNSADASNFWAADAALASLLYPLLPIELFVRFESGILTMSATIPLVELIAQGRIGTDGSEQFVGIGPSSGGSSFTVTPRCRADMAEFVHDDFAGYQEGRPSTEATGPYYVLKRRRGSKSANDGD